MNVKVLWVAAALATAMFKLSAQELRFANLGKLQLDKGGVIADCRIGYRTLGKLSEDKSNVILFPTWASGTTEQLIGMIGPGKLLDTPKYYIVLVDALSNGVSPSPSNSTAQPRMSFPEITIHDMVIAEHELLTKELHLDHVYAVIGESMGGMQTFDWMVAYPDFMEKAIPIIGSPKLASYDLLLWQAEIDAIKRDPGWVGGCYEHNPTIPQETRIELLAIMTPTAINAQIKSDDISRTVQAVSRMDANDHIRQAEAMMALDVSNCCNHSMAEAAKRVHAKALVIVEKQDHTVTPGPALEFAMLLGAQPEVLDSDFGHLGAGQGGKSSQVISGAIVNFVLARFHGDHPTVGVVGRASRFD